MSTHIPALASPTPSSILPQRHLQTWTRKLRIQVSKNRVGATALGLFGMMAFIIVISPWLPLPDPQAPSLLDRLQPPGHISATGERNWLGTDQLGRDVLARTLLGGRVSLLVASIAVAISGVIGTVIGLVAGFRGGWFDTIVMRLVDFQMALPALLLAIFLLYIIGSSVTNLVLLLSIMGWYSYTRVVRSEVLKLRSAVYVEAARSIGADDLRLMYRHILPQVLPILLVISVLDFGIVMLAESGISFLGLGIQPPGTSWGRMIAEGQTFITTGAWWVFAAPGSTIFLTVLTLRLGSEWVSQILGVQAPKR